MKKLVILLLFFFPFTAFGFGRSVFPSKNTVSHYTTPASIDPINEVINLPDAGVNDRVQLTDRTVNSCSFQATTTNTGGIYLGGPTVTNLNGTNEGIRINPGEGFGPVAVFNSNLLFVATDNAGNKVKMFCN